MQRFDLDSFARNTYKLKTLLAYANLLQRIDLPEFSNGLKNYIMESGRDYLLPHFPDVLELVESKVRKEPFRYSLFGLMREIDSEFAARGITKPTE